MTKRGRSSRGGRTRTNDERCLFSSPLPLSFLPQTSRHFSSPSLPCCYSFFIRAIANQVFPSKCS